jgi:hypothetical protein
MINVNYCIVDNPIDDDFQFTLGENEYGTLAVFGPRGGATIGGKIYISPKELELIRNGKKHLYIWHSVVYYDVFIGTHVHVTKCLSEEFLNHMNHL